MTRQDVLAAVAAVEEPLLHRSLGELGLVKGVDVSGDHVRVQVAVPASRYPLKDELREAVAEAAGRQHDGAVEISLVPLDEHEEADLRRQLQPADAPSPLQDTASRTRVIAVASGKGGVGKSSVTVNLAIQLSKMGKRTAVIDADVWGFSIPRMLGVEYPPTAIDHLIIPPVAYGVACVSIGFFVDEDQPVIWRGPMLHKALEQFLTDVYWGDADYCLIDMPPGTGDVSLSMAQYLPRAEVVVVTTPQPAAQRVAQRAGAMARKVNLSVLGVVENMSWFTADDGHRYELFGRGGGEELAAKLGVPLLGQIPLEPALREGGDDGRPISVDFPEAETSQAFARIAQAIDELGPRRRRRPELTVRPA